MGATSLVKFMHANSGGSEPLHWGRADLDGAPFRGAMPPMATEDEMESRLVKVADPHNQTFDTSDPEQNKQYLAVLDKITNGWCQLIHRKHILVRTRHKQPDGTVVRDVNVKVYMEWVEPYMQDGQPMHAQRPYLGRPNND